MVVEIQPFFIILLYYGWIPREYFKIKNTGIQVNKNF